MIVYVLSFFTTIYRLLRRTLQGSYRYSSLRRGNNPPPVRFNSVTPKFTLARGEVYSLRFATSLNKSCFQSERNNVASYKSKGSVLATPPLGG